MSKKATTTVKKTTVKSTVPEKVQEQKPEPVEEKSESILECLNLEELSPGELVSKIENDAQYEEIFNKLNELFLGYSNDMTVIDQKRQKVIDLMKAMHAEFKQKQGTTNDDDNLGNDEDEIEDEEEETQQKPAIKKATQSASTKKPVEPETNDEAEIEVPKKPVAKKTGK